MKHTTGIAALLAVMLFAVADRPARADVSNHEFRGQVTVIVPLVGVDSAGGIDITFCASGEVFFDFAPIPVGSWSELDLGAVSLVDFDVVLPGAMTLIPISGSGVEIELGAGESLLFLFGSGTFTGPPLNIPLPVSFTYIAMKLGDVDCD